MRILNFVLILIAFTLIACNSHKPQPKKYKSQHLIIEPVNDHIYKHTSFLETKSYGLYPCNGMVYINGNEAIIYDTPATNEASTELIAWLKDFTIKAVVVTHFHDDCLGGIDIFHNHNIPSYASELTAQLALEKHQVAIKHNFSEKLTLDIGNETASTLYFGQGHTIDNVVGYIASEKALFGGCLIKELNASKGNLNDANTKQWSQTVSKIKKEIPDIEIVIPGHGAVGNIELLNYTISLFDSYEQ